MSYMSTVGHAEDDVYSDIAASWGILRSGGVMIGYDYHMVGYVGVICAVNRFSREKSLQSQTLGSKWVLVKP